MKKIIITLICFILTRINGFGKEINKINIVGNIRYNELLYKNFLNIDENKKFTDIEKNRIVKDLFASELVDNVGVEYKNKILTVFVKEKPFIKKINFIGNKKLTEDYIKSSLKLKVKEIFSDNLLKQDIKLIRDFYNSIGFLDTTMDYKIENIDDNLVEITFNIKEGKKAKVNSIKFIGNKKFSDFSLKEKLYTRENAFYRFGNKIVYNQDMFDYDCYLLEQFYHSKGYLEFNIISKNAIYNKEKNNFDILINVNEGEQYSYGNFEIINNIKNFNTEFIEKLLKDINHKNIFDINKIREINSKINDFISERGYNVYANPQIITDNIKKKVDIKIIISNQRNIYIGKINIIGNNKTYDKVIRGKLLLQEGDIFSADKLKESIRKINGLGFLNNVNYKEKLGLIENQVDIDIDFEEGSSGYINFAVGFSTIDGMNASIGLSQKNLFGEGIFLNTSISVYETSKVFSFSLSKPNIFDTNIEWSTDLFFNDYANSKANSINIGYDTFSTGFGNYFSYDLTKNLAHKLGYSFELNKFKNISIDYDNILNKKKEYTSKISNGLYYDKRDNPYDPTSGWFITSDIDIAGIGGNKDYIKNVIKFTTYYPILPSVILKTELKYGAIKSIGSNKLFPSDGFYLGGYSMRGFESGGIGPRVKNAENNLEDGYGIGGTNLYYGNVEVKFPLGLPREFRIYGILFFSIGKTTGIENNKEVNKDLIVDSNTFRSSCGLSIMWQSAMGNISLDFSKVLKKEYYDLSENFNFNVGTNF